MHRVEEDMDSNFSEEATEGMGIKSKGMLRDQINFYQQKI